MSPHTDAGVDVLASGVVPDATGRYRGWPSVVCHQGALLVVCSGRREAHICPYGRVEFMRSNDLGQTWSAPRLLSNGPLDDRDAGVLVTRRGTILVNWFTSLAWVQTMEKPDFGQHMEPEARQRMLERWATLRDQLDPATRAQALGCWMARSEDGGNTWSAPYDTIVNSSHGPAELRDGGLLYVGKRLWTGGDNLACASRDDGRSWERLGPLPTRAGDDPQKYHEFHAVQAGDGRIIAQIRNHNSADHYETLQSESRDGGRTWTTPHTIGVWGYPSHLLRLPDGRLLMSYGHRREPLSIQVRTSSDHGQSWSEPWLLARDITRKDMGYPATAVCPDGSLFTLWYQRPDAGAAVLRWRRWRL